MRRRAVIVCVIDVGSVIGLHLNYTISMSIVYKCTILPKAISGQLLQSTGRGSSSDEFTIEVRVEDGIRYLRFWIRFRMSRKFSSGS